LLTGSSQYGAKGFQGLWATRKSQKNNFEIKTTQLVKEFDITKIYDETNAPSVYYEEQP
jgi:hypothetical protein